MMNTKGIVAMMPTPSTQIALSLHVRRESHPSLYGDLNHHGQR